MLVGRGQEREPEGRTVHREEQGKQGEERRGKGDGKCRGVGRKTGE